MVAPAPESPTHAPSVAVIGAGASGLMAALFAAWQGAAVTLFERNNSLGRKLLITGSGRCNLTNAAVAPAAYACADPSWLEALFRIFGRSHLLETLERIGVPTRATHDGWYYPLSESAQSVAAAFSAALDAAGGRLLQLAHLPPPSRPGRDRASGHSEEIPCEEHPSRDAGIPGPADRGERRAGRLPQAPEIGWPNREPAG